MEALSIRPTNTTFPLNNTTEVAGGEFEHEYTIPTYWPMTATKYIDWIYPPLALFIANVCNVLSVLVMSRPNMRSTSIGIYLLFLAICDLIYLNAFLIPAYIEYVTEYSVNVVCLLKCKLSLTLLNLFSHLASWIIVAVSVDRVIMVSKPLHAAMYCTPKRALRVCLAMFLTFLIFDGKELVTTFGRYFIPGTNNFIFLFSSQTYQKYWNKYGIWILTLLNHITFPLICILNIIIVYYLHKTLINRRMMASPDELVKKSKSLTSQKEIKFTKVLLFVSTSSVIMNIPFACLVILLLGGYWKNEEHTLYENVLLWFWYKLTQAIATTHRASYFFLYCLTGEKFRDELKSLLNSVLRRNVRQESNLEASSNTTLSIIQETTKD